MTRYNEFDSARLQHLQPAGKHRSQGPPGSTVYNPTAKKTGAPGKHVRSYNGARIKSYSGPGKHSAGYTGKRRLSG